MEGRDWAGYNEALVRRGEVLLDLAVLEDWEKELRGLNMEKEGARFQYPEGFMRLLGFIRPRLLPPTLQADRGLHPRPRPYPVPGRI